MLKEVVRIGRRIIIDMQYFGDKGGGRSSATLLHIIIDIQYFGEKGGGRSSATVLFIGAADEYGGSSTSHREVWASIWRRVV